MFSMLFFLTLITFPHSSWGMGCTTSRGWGEILTILNYGRISFFLIISRKSFEILSQNSTHIQTKLDHDRDYIIYCISIVQRHYFPGKIIPRNGVMVLYIFCKKSGCWIKYILYLLFQFFGYLCFYTSFPFLIFFCLLNKMLTFKYGFQLNHNRTKSGI